MLGWICLVVFFWGLVDLLSGLRTISFVPLILLSRFFSKKPRIGYSKDEVERMFTHDHPEARKDESGQWVDGQGIPFL